MLGDSKTRGNLTAAGERLTPDAIPLSTGRTTPQRSPPYNGVGPMTEMEMRCIGGLNDEDILKCLDVWNFISHYCPTDVISVEKLREWGRTLAKDSSLDFDDCNGPLVADDHVDAAGEQLVGDVDTKGNTPSETKRDDPRSRYFSNYVTLCAKIKSQCIKDGLHCNNGIGTVAHGTVAAETAGSYFQISGCFVKEATVGEGEVVAKDLESTDILVVFEHERDNISDVVFENRLKVVSAATHILLDDARRKFLYCISVEGQWMTLWYFARDHCVRTTFNWWKDKATTMSVFLSFMCATEEDLGVDPRVHLLPPSGNHTKVARRYIYELEDKTQTKHYYRTEKSVMEADSLCLIGRNTRIFRVVEVESKSDDADYKDRPRQVLKDTWMDAKNLTEGEIQTHLFADIQNFVNSPVSQQHARLEPWVENGALRSDIAEYMAEGGKQASKDFRKLFLCIKLESTGQPSKAIPAEYLQVPDRTTFNSNSVETDNSLFRSTSRFTSQTAPSPLVQSGSKLLSRYPTKKRTFIIFDDYCQPVYALPTVGAAFGVLRSTVIALLLMYGANWVHRDVSAGNVMALWNPATKEWESKLGDFEYARVFVDQDESHDPKIGTAYFMAAEVLMDDYFRLEHYVVPTQAQRNNYVYTTPSLVPKVVHNFYHDVESIFWIVYWIVTCRVNYRRSQDFVAWVFSHDMKGNVYRNMALSYPMTRDFMDALHPDLRPLFDTLELLRKRLWSTVLTRMSTKLPLFSHSHFQVFMILGEICNADEKWNHVRLERSDSESESESESDAHRSIESQTSVTRTVSGSGSKGPRVPKRGRQHDQHDEGAPTKKRFKHAVSYYCVGPSPPGTLLQDAIDRNSSNLT